MFDKSKGILNMHKLNILTVEKLGTKLVQLLNGEYLYRTIDGRILDFWNGVEHHHENKKFQIREARCTPIEKYRRYQTQVTFYPTTMAHVNRNLRKKRKTKKKR